jgi:hypothetical protein
MTVSSAIAKATSNWTGVEATFTPGFQALNAGDVSVSWANLAGASGTLTLNTHFTVSLDAANYATVNVIAFPAAPATITIARNSSPLQIDGFQDGVPWSAAVIETSLDRLTLRDQELQRDLAALGAALAAAQARLDQINDLSGLQTMQIGLSTSEPSTPGTLWSNNGVVCITPGASATTIVAAPLGALGNVLAPYFAVLAASQGALP